LSQICQQLDIVTMRFAEAKTRIDDRKVLTEPCRNARIHAFGEERRNLGHNVLVFRFVLHGAWFAPHMHQANGNLEISCRRKRAIGSQRENVVDHRCTRRDCFTHHLWLAGIHRNRHIRNRSDCLNDRNHAIELLLLSDAFGTRAG
jgi:hypothetical protein